MLVLVFLNGLCGQCLRLRERQLRSCTPGDLGNQNGGFEARSSSFKHNTAAAASMEETPSPPPTGSPSPNGPAAAAALVATPGQPGQPGASQSVGLVPLHAFGIAPRVGDNIYFVDDDRVVYPVGRHIAILKLSTRTIQWIMEDKNRAITAMAISPDRKYLAVCETILEGDGPPQISVYDLAKRKRSRILTHPDVTDKEFTCVAFTGDSRDIIAVTGRLPERRPAEPAAGDPGALDGAVAVGQPDPPQGHGGRGGPGDPGLGPPDRPDPPAVLGADVPVRCLAPYGKGFMAAGDGGRMAIFEIDHKEVYKQKGPIIQAPRDDLPVTGLAMAPNERQLVCVLGGCQLCLARTQVIESAPDSRDVFQYVGGGSHGSAITGLSSCVRKPLLASCSADGWVRVWNYMDRLCELAKAMESPAECVSLHPSGFHLLVGCTDRLRLYNIHHDGLVLVRDFPQVKQCKEVLFSNGGHLFAVAHAKVITIFATYTCEALFQLKAHAAPVRALQWSRDDRYLATAGLDGAVYEWRGEETGASRTANEYVVKACRYQGIAYSGHRIVACGNEGSLREVAEGQCAHHFQARDCYMNQLALTGDKALFAGTSKGVVQVYGWPLVVDKHDEMAVHQGPPRPLQPRAPPAPRYHRQGDGPPIQPPPRPPLTPT
ncbi:putative flagellar associated protein [Paratrimastix pyriformis]|uniref:Flagellar associated protein n=1 Tax=Paratrimastix pyriformis TaxID=342808 RepID=A0ABQ8UMR4_9EUKA|nr:putative flagellar associated protein [Paratrimastix pyriformis]